MDKLAADMIELIRALHAVNLRLVAIGEARQNAIRALDVEAMNALVERERLELITMAPLEKTRLALVARIRKELGAAIDVTATNVAARSNEPLKTQLLVVSAELKGTVEKLDRLNRMNSKISQALVASFARVLKVVTGVAQHAGLYMANGRKAVIRGIHLLDATA